MKFVKLIKSEENNFFKSFDEELNILRKRIFDAKMRADTFISFLDNAEQNSDNRKKMLEIYDLLSEADNLVATIKNK